MRSAHQNYPLQNKTWEVENILVCRLRIWNFNWIILNQLFRLQALNEIREFAEGVGEDGGAVTIEGVSEREWERFSFVSPRLGILKLLKRWRRNWKKNGNILRSKMRTTLKRWNERHNVCTYLCLVNAWVSIYSWLGQLLMDLIDNGTCVNLLHLQCNVLHKVPLKLKKHLTKVSKTMLSNIQTKCLCWIFD